MPRNKKYNELEVIEKATNLFWHNGYNTTSMQMLEKEMGINKFSIYSSFGSKEGLLLESLKHYHNNLFTLLNKLEISSNGVNGIKEYFFDFVKFSKSSEFGKGCLGANTMNELGSHLSKEIGGVLNEYSQKVQRAFINSLQQDTSKNEVQIKVQVDYLLIALMGLTFATKVFNETQLENYIQHIFKNI